MKSEVVKGVQNVLKGLNLYTIWFAIWLIEAYYLTINVFYDLFINEFKFNINMPNKIVHYNEELLKYLSDYSSALLLLAFIVFCSGFLLAPIKFLPKLGDYKLIYRFADYGMSCGFWLIMICFTYIAYESLNVLFLFLPGFMLLLCEGLKKLEEVLKDKYGITFRG